MSEMKVDSAEALGSIAENGGHNSLQDLEANARRLESGEGILTDDVFYLNGSTSRAQYKTAVIIGNGPSSLSLSYMLDGNWPYYNGTGHPIDYLQTKLESNINTPVMLQDMTFLSDGLEGRSANPVAILYDTLARPGADVGLINNSVLSWQHHPDMAIDHVVIGRGKPGGAWQSMEGSTLTVSLGSWMELPGLPFLEYLSSSRPKRISTAQRQHRTTVSSVAHYYTEYVRLTGLKKYMRNNSVVTSVEPMHQPKSKLEKVNSICSENSECHDRLRCRRASENCSDTMYRNHFCSGIKDTRIRLEANVYEDVPLHQGIPSGNNGKKVEDKLWKVTGYTNKQDSKGKVIKEPFTYVTSNVVLAVGCYDKPNQLNIPGEDLPFVIHSLSDLEILIKTRKLTPDSPPILVVGAGLTAADAIITAHFYGISVVHTFRRSVTDKNLIFNKLPTNLYPEYHKIHQMMSGKGEGYDGYKPVEKGRIVEIKEDGKVLVESPKACNVFQTSYVLILVGCKPNLYFLPKAGRGLGINLVEEIDSRSNPIDINAYTHECHSAPGLYALGPLVGDNFVRFVQGGSLAVASSIVKKKTGSSTVACWWDNHKDTVF